MLPRNNNPIYILKHILPCFVLCLFLLLPTLGWTRDGGDNWRNLSPQEKENVLRNYQRWQNLPPRDKEHLREEWDRWQNLPQNRREQLKRRYDEFRRHRSDD
jgi:hypothetical protein